MSMYVGEPNDPGATPFWAEALGHMPGTTQTIGLNMFRGSNTILGGGFGPEGAALRHRDLLNPRAATRYRSSTAFHQNQSGMNLLTNRFSYLDHKTGAVNAGVLGRPIERQAGKAVGSLLTGGQGNRVGNWAIRTGMVDNAGKMNPVWDGGFLGRISASGRASRLSNIGSRQAGHIWSSVGQMGGEDLVAASRMGMLGTTPEMAVAMAGKGAWSSYATGFATHHMHQTEELAEWGLKNRARFMAGRAVGERFAGDVAGKTLKSVGKDVVARGLEKAALREGASFLGKRAALAGAGFLTGPLMPFVEAGIAIWTAFDIARLGGAALKVGVTAAARAGGKAFNSLKGGIDKSPFGTGYVDNEVAATSRARGVMAIQNSRLNARSALGSEAAMMHAHFG